LDYASFSKALIYLSIQVIGGQLADWPIWTIIFTIYLLDFCHATCLFFIFYLISASPSGNQYTNLRISRWENSLERQEQKTN
jgi:predicted membrane-bound dolichyl-phosphate-mannose-protein mannosyltransferase